jgi:hypothetical protein
MNRATPDITVRRAGRFFFVQVDGETLGHAYKIVPPIILIFVAPIFVLRKILRRRWGASASVIDPNTGTGRFVDIGIDRGEFASRDEAVRAILAYHGVGGRPRYLRPWSRRELRALGDDQPGSSTASALPHDHPCRPKGLQLQR